MLKKILVLILLLNSILIYAELPENNAQLYDYINDYLKNHNFCRIAVIDAEGQNYIFPEIESDLLKHFNKNKNLMIVDRQSIKKAIDEITFSFSDLVDPTTQIKVGKFVGATHILVVYYQEKIGRLIEIETIAVRSYYTIQQSNQSTDANFKNDNTFSFFNICLNGDIGFGLNYNEFITNDEGNVVGSYPLAVVDIGVGIRLFNFLSSNFIIGVCYEKYYIYKDSLYQDWIGVDQSNFDLNVYYGGIIKIGPLIKTINIYGEILFFNNAILKGQLIGGGLSFHDFNVGIFPIFSINNNLGFIINCGYTFYL